ncbi:MAG: hypothetical protein KDK23_03530 [Leptospiraceae bacterium]|nr:hypothetical protein [Leptospiraceae bacterium]
MRHWKLTSLLLALLTATPVLAIGTHAEGWMVVKKLTKLESQGIIFDSYEGEFIATTYNSDEKCSEDDYECFSPVDRTIKFSIRPENKEVIEFLQNNKDSSFLIQYRIHRIENLGLKEDFEILKAVAPGADQASPAPSMTVDKTGSRQFTFRGKFLQLDDQGTIVKTFEGLYLDEKTGKVHPFSVTNEGMAKHIYDVMKTGKTVYIGVSDAIVTGFRKSDYDIYSVNENEPGDMQ